MRKAFVLFSLLAAGSLLLAMGCQQRQEMEEAGPPVDTSAVAMDTGAAAAPTPPPGEAAGGGDVALGKQVYDANCMTCHGTDGTGMGPAGAGLQPPPANFADAEWKYGGDLESIKKTIMNGVPGTAMIPWKGTLSDQEIDAVAKHEMAFSKGGATASAR